MIGSASVGISLIVTGGSIAILAHYYLCRTQAQQPPQSLRRYAIKTTTLFTFGAAKFTLGILQILNATYDSNFPNTLLMIGKFYDLYSTNNEENQDERQVKTRPHYTKSSSLAEKSHTRTTRNGFGKSGHHGGSSA